MDQSAAYTEVIPEPSTWMLPGRGTATFVFFRKFLTHRIIKI
jgi:hypothetical protein